MKDESSSDPITKRLDIIIRMMLESKKEQDEKLNTGDQLVFLESTGLSSTEAARILGINPNHLTYYRRRARLGTGKGMQAD
jgi:transposase-like protein